MQYNSDAILLHRDILSTDLPEDKEMGQVTSGIAKCIQQVAISRPTYIYELEALRQVVVKLEKQVVRTSLWRC